MNINLAVNRIKVAFDRFGSGLFSGHSGGKDSCVIHHLIKMAGINDIKIVHNVKPLLGTSGDPIMALTEQHPLTLNFLYTEVCKDTTVDFLHSSKMKDFIRKNNLVCQIDGARISEWNRPGKSSEIVVNGKKVSRLDMPEFVEYGLFDISFLYPIYDWTDDDVFDFLIENDIKFSQEYNVNGEFSTYLHGKWKIRRY